MVSTATGLNIPFMEKTSLSTIAAIEIVLKRFTKKTGGQH
jgi:hypothetical protein